MEDFGIKLERKVVLLESLRKGFAEEFNINKMIKDQINQKYRTFRKELVSLFNEGSELREEMSPAIELLEKRSHSLRTKIAEYVRDNGQQDFEQFMESYIHMICNRLFISSQRKHELVIYDFLYKVYMSIKMRSLSTLKVKRIPVTS